MPALPKVRAVFVKELRDSLRDRRTIFASIVVPVMLWPVVMLLMSEATQVAQSKVQSEQYQIVIEPEAALPYLEKQLTQALNFVHRFLSRIW